MDKAYLKDLKDGVLFTLMGNTKKFKDGNILMTTDVVDYYTHRRLCVGADGKAEFLRLDHNILK